MSKSAKLMLFSLLHTTDTSTVSLVMWRWLMGAVLAVYAVEISLFFAGFATGIQAVGLSLLFSSIALWSIRSGRTPVRVMVRAVEQPVLYWLVVFTWVGVAAFLLFASVSILQ